MDLILSPAEVEQLTRYKRPADQLRELKAQGFYRARLGRDGKVVLERAHYHAVSRGETQAAPGPKVRLLVRHA